MFDSIYLVLVVFLLVLACIDLFVGVSNDAVNFLNSAVGCRIAPLHIIMIVASLGVLLGATFSSGMMEVARKGMFNPDMFTFQEIIILFFSVMIADVLLLNVFNSMGLPTSTTVSIVFELLGAAVCVSAYKLYGQGNSLLDIYEYIKADKTITILSAILVSVVVAFVSGAVVQFVLRLLFAFRYQNSYKYFGALFSGFSLTSILYFLVMKGAKGASFMKPEYIDFINTHTSTILWAAFIGLTVFSELLILLKVNIFKIIILAGTFALAFSFAGNDLVNFIGVPLAALDSFMMWSASGLMPDAMMMDGLNQNAHTSTFFLVAAGVIMIVTLWFSKKAKRVIQTAINLSSSSHGEKEQFGATTPGRVLTRIGLITARTIHDFAPAPFKRFVAARYLPVPVVRGQITLPFDYVRASVNLVLAAILISSATSLKLPLSTTYVTFMVAMGTSFADGAWDRESAVYRISGVITVIAGWFLTGFCAFIAAGVTALLISGFGSSACIVLMLLAVAIIIRSNFIKPKTSETVKAVINAKGSDRQILAAVTAAVPRCYDANVDVIERVINNFFTDHEAQLRRARNKASNIEDSIARERAEYYQMAIDSNNNESIDAKHFFYLVFTNILEASRSVHKAANAAFIHVANRHRIFSGDLEESLRELFKRLIRIGNDVRKLARDPSPEVVETMIKHARRLNRDVDKDQTRLVTLISEESIPMRSAELYLTLLQTIRDMVNRYVAVSMQARALSQIAEGRELQTAETDEALLRTRLGPAVVSTTKQKEDDEAGSAEADKKAES